MIKVLTKAYPCNKDILNNLIISTLIGLFVFTFLYIFEPFDYLMNYSTMIIVGYGAITFSVSFIIAAVLPLFFKNYFNENNWTVGKEILHIGFIMFSIGVANFFYAAPYAIHEAGENVYSVSNFLLSIGITLTIGLMPIIIVVLYNQTRLLKKYISESEKINRIKHDKKLSEDEVVFYGEGKNEQLKFANASILFIKSENNYCEIYLSEIDSPQKQLLRGTLTSIEDTLKGFDAFIRVHRSYIINSNNIEKVSGTAQGYKIHFNGVEAPVPVSRNKSAEFKLLVS